MPPAAVRGLGRQAWKPLACVVRTLQKTGCSAMSWGQVKQLRAQRVACAVLNPAPWGWEGGRLEASERWILSRSEGRRSGALVLQDGLLLRVEGESVPAPLTGF